MIKLLLADDHQIVLDGLKSLLIQEENFQIVQEVPDGELVLKALEVEEVDIVILDIEMPRLNGVETTKIIRQNYPQVKVLILSMYHEEDFIRQIVQAGASGYVLKNKGKEELIDAINKVANGGDYFGESVTKVLIEAIKNSGAKKAETKLEVVLTKREKEVLQLIADGLTTPQIAEKLFIAHSTVETHRRNLIDKTSSANTKSLIRYAFTNNLVH